MLRYGSRFQFTHDICSGLGVCACGSNFRNRTHERGIISSVRQRLLGDTDTLILDRLSIFVHLILNNQLFNKHSERQRALMIEEMVTHLKTA